MSVGSKEVVHGDLTEIPREMGTAAYKNIKRASAEQSASAQSPEHSLGRPMTSKEVAGSDIRIFRNIVVSSRSQCQRRWVVKLKDDKLNDFV
jgi:hypothetical protein